MTIPKIEIRVFTADECQALLDLFDRILRGYQMEVRFDITKEELIALEKLREAGKFYAPQPADNCEKCGEPSQFMTDGWCSDCVLRLITAARNQEA